MNTRVLNLLKQKMSELASTIFNLLNSDEVVPQGCSQYAGFPLKDPNKTMVTKSYEIEGVNIVELQCWESAIDVPIKLSEESHWFAKMVKGELISYGVGVYDKIEGVSSIKPLSAEEIKKSVDDFIAIYS